MFQSLTLHNIMYLKYAKYFLTYIFFNFAVQLQKHCIYKIFTKVIKQLYQKLLKMYYVVYKYFFLLKTKNISQETM